MCWSASVSLNTFIFSLFGTVFALVNKTITMKEALFFMSFVSIQFVEFLAWRNLGDTGFASRLGLFLVLLQAPLAVNAFYTGPYKTQILATYVGLVVLYLATSSPIFAMRPAPNGHLTWDWSREGPNWFWIPWLALFCLGLLYLSPAKRVFAFILLSVSIATFLNQGTFASMWCWFANVYTLYLIGEVFYKELCI